MNKYKVGDIILSIYSNKMIKIAKIIAISKIQLRLETIMFDQKANKDYYTISVGSKIYDTSTILLTCNQEVIEILYGK